MVFRRILIILAVLGISFAHAFAASIVIAPEQLRDLKDQRNQLGAQIKKLDNISKQIAAVQAEKSGEKDSIKRLEAESNDARISLEKMQNFDRESPGSISPEKLKAAADRNKQAYSAVKDAKEHVAGADAKINTFNSDASVQYAEFLRLQTSFERDVSRVVDVHVGEQVRALQVSKEVEVTERVPCGDDSVPVCKERSKKAAELKATERGSAVLVNSFTEVKNFKLSKEELRSEVQATLTNKVFSNQHFVNDSEYETTIKATVVPAISNAMREQMASAIRSEVYAIVGGKIDYSQVQNPSKLAGGGQPDAQADEEAPPPVKPAKSKKKIEPQQETPVVEEEPPPPPQRAPRKLEKPTFTF